MTKPKRLIKIRSEWFSDSALIMSEIAGKSIFDVIQYFESVLRNYNDKQNELNPRGVIFVVERGDYDEDDSIRVTWQEEETDYEYNKRMAKTTSGKKAAQTAKAKKEAVERKQYERLKKKFEPESVSP